MDRNGKLFGAKLEVTRRVERADQIREEQSIKLDWVGVIRVNRIMEEQGEWIKDN